MQSALLTQVWPLPHLPHELPPQSMPVSVPFCTPSKHWPGAHLCVVTLQTALAQSCDSATSVLARESSDYSAAACLSAYVLPDSGHDINLHPNAPEWFAYANDWMARHAYAGCG